jgi:hypothetical protein
MSGLYTAVFGVHPAAGSVLKCLGLELEQFGRFRDAHVANGEIAIYTRCGGPNRAAFGFVFDQVRAHPLYLRDVDDKFDPTYATIYFRIPPEHAEFLRSIDIGKPWDPDARWKEKVAELEALPREELIRRADKLLEHVRVTVIEPKGTRK